MARALVTLMSLLLSLGGAIAVPTPVAAANPVTITNSGSPNPVTSGTQLTYTIVVTNTGGSKLTSLNLSDQVNGLAGLGVPPQLVLTSSAGSCGQNNFQVTCSVASLWWICGCRRTCWASCSSSRCCRRSGWPRR